MSVGKEIKVVLSLDDSGFSVKVRKNSDEVKGLSGQLDKLTGATEKVESGMAGMSGNMKGFADGFASLNRSISATVDSLQKNLLGGLSSVNKGIKDAASQAKAAATAQIDAKLKTLQNEIDTNKKLLESRAKAYNDLRKLESDMRAQALSAQLAAEKARRSKKAGAGAVAAGNLNEAARLTNNADAVRREIAATDAMIASTRTAQAARMSSIASLEAERKAVLANVEAKMQMDRVSAAVGKSNEAEIARIRQMAAEREAQAGRTAVKNAESFARQKKAYADQEARDAVAAEAEKTRAARAAEAERLRLAREAAAERRRIARMEVEEQRRQAKMVADMWKGMAQMYGGAKIEQGIKSSVGAADADQRARIMVQALNLPKDQEQALFADAQKMSGELGFVSTKDVIDSKMSAISSLGYNNTGVIDATLGQAIKAANNMELLGAGHGDLQSTLRNIYGVTEMRQQTADPAAMLKTFDLLNKAMIGTAGKVNLADVETALRRVGAGASSLSDEGLVNMIGLIDQFKVSGGDGGSGGGVSTVGTIVKMMQAYATGKTKSNKAVEEFVGAGILDENGLDLGKDDAHVLKDAKNGKFKNVEMWIRDPIRAMQDMVPQIVAYTRKNKSKFYQNGADDADTRNQMLAVQQYLQTLGITQSAVQAVTAVGTPAARERLEHQAVTINRADTVDQTADRLKKSYTGEVKAFGAQLYNFKIIIGDTLLPSLTKLLEYASKFVIAFRDFGQNNPIATTVSTLASGVGGLVLSVKGFLSMFGTAGFMGVLRAFVGIAPTAAGGAGAIAGGLTLLGKAFKTLAAVMLAWDIGTMIGEWLSAFKVGGLAIGQYVENMFTVMEYRIKSLMLLSEEWAAKSRGFFHLDDKRETAGKLADIAERRVDLEQREIWMWSDPDDGKKKPAKKTAAAGAEAKVGAPTQSVNDVLAARMKDAAAGAGRRKDRDPLNQALGEEEGKMNAAKTKLDALVAGGETLESLRQQAVDLVEGKRKAGDYSVNHDKDKNPAADDPRIKKLKEETFQAMLYNEQIKAVTFANERVAASELEANAAMNALENGGLAKQTDAFKALSKEMERAEQRLGAGTEAFQKWNIAKASALYEQARADDTTFALSYVDKNRQSKAQLATTERERIRMQQEAEHAAEDAQMKARRSALDKTYEDKRSAIFGATLGDDSGIQSEQQRYELLDALDANYQRTKDDADKQYSERRKLRAEEEARALESATANMAREWKDVGKAVDDIGASAGNSFVSMLTNSLSTGRLAVGDFIRGVLMDIANAKLKETLADPLNGVITQGTDWLKNSVFGGQGAGQAAATAERTSAEISATAATTTFSATIMTEALPALQMLASSAAQAAGGSVIGSVANYLFADGGIMTSMGPLQLRKYANGGVANSPQVAIYGEAGPEAYVPLPDGRTIPVTINGSGMGAGNVQVNVINQTSTSVTAQQGAPRFDGKQMILDVVLTAATSPGSFRSGLKEAMK